ncbi:unnamed protein product [Candidula unifasciata]|uniref:Monocarboxylate transporter n=1 Tax=Candidula unifasciata TaxID=100452 RepID=A0A8S3YQG9_9EUPU|nr:unnamed protein product [Candidula unifasciata]
MTVARAREKTPPPLDRGWSWMVALGVFICVFFMVGIAKSYGLFLLAFQKHFGVSTAYAAMPVSLTAFVYSLGGIGNSCFYGNGLVMIGKYFRTRRSLATGLGLAGASIGQFAMPPIIEYLLETYGLSGTLLIIGALYGHCAISGALFRPIEQYGPVESPVKAACEREKNGHATLTDTPSARNGRDALTEVSAAALDHAVHHSNNRNSVNKERKCVVSFVEVDTLELDVSEGDSPSVDQLDDDDDDAKSYLERKVLLASTGSVFLVSPSTLDVSVVDSKAHGLDAIKDKKSISCLRRIFDFSVLKSYITIYFIIVSFLCFFGYFNHILFLPAINNAKGITKYHNALLISICGIGDLIARIGTGFIADLNLIPRYQLKAMACVLSGINIFVFIYADTFAWLAFHCFCYGFLGGAYVCLMSVVLVDFVGVQLMAKNLAIVLLIQGVGAAVGQIFLGWVKDQTGSFTSVIVILSLNMISGGLLLFCYQFIRRWEDARLARLSDLDKASRHQS